MCNLTACTARSPQANKCLNAFASRRSELSVILNDACEEYGPVKVVAPPSPTLHDRVCEFLLLCIVRAFAQTIVSQNHKQKTPGQHNHLLFA